MNNLDCTGSEKHYNNIYEYLRLRTTLCEGCYYAFMSARTGVGLGGCCFVGRDESRGRHARSRPGRMSGTSDSPLIPR